MQNIAMVLHRAFRYRLSATAEQEALLRQFAGVVRLVYNLALEQRRDWWRHYARKTGAQLDYGVQARELTALRAAYDWIAAVSQTCQQQALRDLDRAYQTFFAGRAGYPTPRRKGVQDAFRFQGREVEIKRVNRSWGMVRLPKIGQVRFRWPRAMIGTVRNVTVARDALGWHVCFACEIAVEDDAVAPAATVGIDRGVARTLAFSDIGFAAGGFADLPRDRLRRLDRRARTQARALARCQRGSRRRQKAKQRLAASKARAARLRRHWNFGTVCIEALNTRAMTASARGTIDAPGTKVRQKAGLNRAILEQGWHQFERFLGYKLAARGGQLITVPAAFTGQTCACCNSVSKSHRKSQAVFICADCGHVADADTNAAINIRKAGTRPSDANCAVRPVVRESLMAAQQLHLKNLRPSGRGRR